MINTTRSIQEKAEVENAPPQDTQTHTKRMNSQAIWSKEVKLLP